MIHRFPTIHHLAKASYDEFFPYYDGLGYYSRARNLLKTAWIISQKRNGIFPKDSKELMSLPWIGSYTAEAIRSFWFCIPTLAWDTNLEKVFSRFYHGTKYIRISQSEKEEIQKDLFLYLTNNPHITSRNINSALMDFANEVDLKNTSQIQWDTYLFQDGEFFRTQGKKEVQEEKKKLFFPIPDAEIIIVLHENHTTYYSENKDKYAPFIISPIGHRDIRWAIKKYFQEKYNLTLSIRPPKRQWLKNDEKPTILCFAQIQAGHQNFISYERTQFKKHNFEY